MNPIALMGRVPTDQIIILGVSMEDYMLPCYTKQIFGFDCPGCGFQRAVVLFFQGQWVDSFLMYPALFPLLALFGLGAVNKLTSWIPVNVQMLLYKSLGILAVVFIITNFIYKLFQHH